MHNFGNVTKNGLLKCDLVIRVSFYKTIIHCRPVQFIGFIEQYEKGKLSKILTV